MFKTEASIYWSAYPIFLAMFISAGSSGQANALDVNLTGGANININNANNNKMTTSLKNFTPVPLPSGQIDIMPVGTPPVTSTVTSYFGPLVNTDIVDPDYPDHDAAKVSRQGVGLYAGKLPQAIPDDQPIKPDDVQKFLQDYNKYLKDEQLQTSGDPAQVIDPSLPVLNRVKNTSAVTPLQENSVELLAGQDVLVAKRSKAKPAVKAASPR